MNANPRKPREVGFFEGSFDSKIKSAVSRLKGVSYADKVRLLNDIVSACQEQVEDCCDSITSALYMVLHDDHGFGQKRIDRIIVRTQETLDGYVERYGIGTVCALSRDLRSRNVRIKQRHEKQT